MCNNKDGGNESNYFDRVKFLGFEGFVLVD